jgi:ABC-2 type transport system ATP-binding protein
VIRARGLGRQFGEFQAVDDVSLEVREGTLLALLGPNGAGKTTTVRMLSGLLAPTRGSASVAGCDVATDPAAVRARVGLVTDVPGLYEQMSAWAYLDFFGRLYGLDAHTRHERIARLLKLFDLDDRADERMVTYSRGMQQKVALGRALLHEPAVLFLDEPTAGLDPLAARSVRDLIVGLKQARRSIVLCTHDLDEADRLADQVAIMQGGRILALDAPDRLRMLASPETQVQITLAPPYPSRAPGGTLAFRTAKPNETNPRLIAELVEEGAKVVSVTCSAPSLEDVYATAIGGRLATSAHNGYVVEGVAEAVASGATPPSDATAVLLIGWRAALESLNDRLTRLMNVFFALVAPVVLLVLVVRPLTAQASEITATLLPFYLLVIGMLPAVGAVGIAAGQFAGERERGVLTPMLASPASNLAIFGGKVLGSILPPVVYSGIAEAIYVCGIVVILGVDQLALLPIGFSIALVVLVPAATCLAAIIATLVSARVRTYNAAQQIAGIVLIPLWGGLFAGAFRLQEWGVPGLVLGVGGLILIDIALIATAARTWRREEVLSQR